MEVKLGDKVKVEYTGTLEDGTVFDSSEKHNHPLEFEVGAKQVITGFEDAILGMKKDEEKEIKLKPEEAYGDNNLEFIKEVPKEQLPKEQEPEIGGMLLLNLPNGQQIPAKIVGLNDDSVTIDLNHPLAGKVLIFKIKILNILRKE
ncbi:MAG: peptidylprolyl isomerase [Nanoarchaeota archaeon]